MATVGEAELRAAFIDSAIKAVALMEYKLRTLFSISTTNAWKNSYFRETNTEITGGTGSPVRGVPRFSPFPGGQVTETKVDAYIEKYGCEGLVSYEDESTNEVSMLQRTIFRIGRAVANAVDIQIEAVLNTDAGNSYAIGAGSEWNSATLANRDPILDLLTAAQTIRADNINPHGGNGYLVVNGTDWTNIAANSKIVNHPTFKTVSVVENGVMGELTGLKIMVTEAVTADQAYIVVAQEAGTWQQAVPLTVEQIRDPGVKTTIRAWELGVLQLVQPNAVCKITNTRA